MKTRLVTALISLALAVFGASSGSAQASLAAGWDFSQYAGDGFMSIDGGSTFVNTLSANYSDLDPTFGAGFGSAAYGTMYVDGQFGSTPVNVGSGIEEFLPSAAVEGSLVSNLDAPTLLDFDAFSVLASEGQVSTESLAMVAKAAASVVFKVDLSPAGRTGSDWVLTLGARTFVGTSNVGVEFSTNGTSFSSFGTLNLAAVDSKFTVPLGTASSARAFVRLNFNPSAPNEPFIDNVALTALLSPPHACGDGLDNDSDGFVDYPADPACQFASSTSEQTQCQDGLDNDGDGKKDFDGGASRGVNPPTLPDPQCTAAWKNKEAANAPPAAGCGIGPELALLLPAFLALRQRRRES